MTEIDYKALDPMLKQLKNLAENAVKRHLNDDVYDLSPQEIAAIAILCGAHITTSADKDNTRVHIFVDNVSVTWDGEQFIIAQQGGTNYVAINAVYGAPEIH